ncbi:macrophage mannose receptor 1-like [Octopus sinensis]|uniref:Macrophage mannose receptor 1-like n=1 Tax=Octopus sinensis TaxID=2607531 RepID=A0A7E6F2B0_9MOLL|nr:macrophage mannose receptor 1-like [Octopus sinensis]
MWILSVQRHTTTEYHEFHMGLCKDLSKKVFVWQDGEALTYSHWGPTEPSNHGGIEDCGSLSALLLSLDPSVEPNPGPMDFVPFKYESEIEKLCASMCASKTSDSLLRKLKLIAECPTSAGYTYQPELRLCYQIGSTITSWNKAADNCNKDRGRLIHIKNEEVMNYLKTILSWAVAHSGQYYIGSSRDLNKNVFVWQTGEAVTYSRWFYPNPSGGNEHCVSLVPTEDFGWNDVPCHNSNIGWQICEIVVQ